MKVLMVCSKAFYGKLLDFKGELENLGHEVYMPNCWNHPETEGLHRGKESHASWKASMFKKSEETIKNVDAILVLNYDKDGKKNYIGGATFLEIYDAFRMNKKIYFVNDLPEGMLHDELIGFSPIVIYGDLSKISS